MAKLKNVANVTKFSWPVAGSVVVGIMLFGVTMYAVRRLPNNAVTSPIKNAANIVNP